MHSAHIAVDATAAGRRVQTCAGHSRAVAALAKANLEVCGLGEAGYLTGLLHDCGKFTDEFDAYLNKAVAGEAVVKGKVIHTFAGVRYLLEQFHAQGGAPTLSDIFAEILAVCIGSHHGLIDLWDEQHRNGFDHRLQKQPEYDQRAIEAFHAECAAEEELRQLFQRADAELSGLYTKKLAPVIRAKSEQFFALGLLARLITSAVVDADRTDTRCFMNNLPLPPVEAARWAACASHVNAHIASFPNATPIQSARRTFSEHCATAAQSEPGLYRLDLPTGGGKTLSALRFAVLHAQHNQLDRVIYTAPLLSIIEQNAKEIRKAVGDTASVLEHHSNLLRDDASQEEVSRTELLQETWDAQVVITTFVQLLNTLFSGKMSSVRRFHSLCRSVIIIDEVQSLPPKLLSMFNIAVNFLVTCCGSTVLLCSATQPAFESAQHRMLPCKRVISEELFRRTVIQDGGNCTMEDIAGRAADLLERSDSLLIVCNTKREAAGLYRMLKDQSDATVFHLSAGMCMAHREQTLEAVNRALDEGTKLICVSTQLIEAGVDISFGAVIRLAAGLDNVVQAAGRCNRHGEHEQPQPVYVCRLIGEKLGSLKEIKDAQDALNMLLAEYERAPARYSNDLSSDVAISDYYKSLYGKMQRGAQDYPLEGCPSLFELLSLNRQFAPEDASGYCLQQAFRTAGSRFEVFDETNESVLVPYGKGVKLIEQLASPRAGHDMAYAGELLKDAKPYAVSLSARQIEALAECGMIYTLLDEKISVVNAEVYDMELGIKEGTEHAAP